MTIRDETRLNHEKYKQICNQHSELYMESQQKLNALSKERDTLVLSYAAYFNNISIHDSEHRPSPSDLKEKDYFEFQYDGTRDEIQITSYKHSHIGEGLVFYMPYETFKNMIKIFNEVSGIPNE